MLIFDALRVPRRKFCNHTIIIARGIFPRYIFYVRVKFMEGRVSRNSVRRRRILNCRYMHTNNSRHNAWMCGAVTILSFLYTTSKIKIAKYFIQNLNFIWDAIAARWISTLAHSRIYEAQKNTEDVCVCVCMQNRRISFLRAFFNQFVLGYCSAIPRQFLILNDNKYMPTEIIMIRK